MKKLTFILIITTFFSCKKESSFDENIEAKTNRKVLLVSLADNVIIPNLEELVIKSTNLKSEIENFTSTPDINSLQNTQTAWKELIAQWKICELYNLSVIKSKALHNKVHTWPCDTNSIKNYINSSDDINSNYLDSKGSSSKGLAAIEFLIFNQNKTSNAIIDSFTINQNSTQIKKYLNALAENLISKTESIRNEWVASGNNYREDFINADSTDVKSSISQLVNLMIAKTEEIKSKKLNTPLSVDFNNIVRPHLLESYRSGTSLSNIEQNEKSLNTLFNGIDMDGNNQYGFDDYLDQKKGMYSENQLLSDKINEQLLIIEKSISSLEDPLYTKLDQQKSELTTLAEQFQELTSLLKVEVVNEVDVTVTFNDSDGD